MLPLCVPSVKMSLMEVFTMGRMNLTMGDSILDYVDEKAKEMGIAKSAFIAMCVDNYKRQEESTKMMPDVQKMLAIMNNIQNNENTDSKA